ncbi:hypothetical protein CEY12_16955 [Chryseobacterium sp. T16E-39]|uniref:DUF7619 domain-containing protein n=1 Tax=Chryseobacterium sp. T16E-39 TaxID=2015076 RepID=UPI000B5B273A|nr:T9SS type A sorting domain-containing protein [Chryseobacterium sp. T16E-39]ASK31698.1 hypothetical protein CEY12_16955 [Chryseobacterium sp. T16E-39]
MNTKLLSLLFFLLLSFAGKGQIVTIPDWNFKTKLLSADSSNFTAKDLSGNYFKIDANNDGEIQISEAEQVSYILVDYSGISSLVGISSFTNLKNLYCRNNSLVSLDLQGLNNLQYLDCKNNLLTSIAIQGLINLQDLDCTNNQLTALDVQGCTNLKKIYCQFNPIPTLDFSGMSSLEYLDFEYNQITSLNLQGCTNLNDLRVKHNQLSTMNLQGLANLVYLSCEYNQLTSLNLAGCTSLMIFDCSYNNLTSLSVQGLIGLQNLTCSFNQLTSVNLQGAVKLEYFYCDNNSISALDVQGNTNLYFLICHNNLLTSLDLHGLANLNNAVLFNNQLATLNLLGCTNLLTLNCQSNQLTWLNAESSILLQNINCSNNPLSMLFIKNGSNENLTIDNLPGLQYVCCDPSQIGYVQNKVTMAGIVGCNVNAYCSFTPGGNYNTITGTVRFDEDNNGCDSNDEFFEHMKLKINDGTNVGYTFINNLGNYNFYTQAGNFTITGEPENSPLFQVIPASFSTSFADNNNHVFTKDMCVKAIGNSNDLEVVVAPVTAAVPGFNSKYRLMWRNKGNTTISGSVVLTFDHHKMNYVSSSLPVSSVSGDQITINFSNIKPFGNTASEIIFTINPPTHSTYPVHSGDILNFSAMVNPVAADINPLDNVFNYKQTVVNSFDPNDIICLEGNSIPVSMVGNYLHYIVNFENTGTAPAANVVVEMDIDPNDFDISTLQLQNSSHQVYTKVSGNKVEFMMKNANLGNGGHGNVLMKVMSKNNLIPGDHVENKANIYFDYNFPIVTNEEMTQIENVLQVVDVKKDDSVKVYPIPTKGDVTIEAGSKIISVEVYDGQGRILQKHTGVDSHSTKITIRSAGSGVYFMKIYTDKGLMLKKVIKN